MDAVHVEMYAGQVSRIMSQAAEFLDAVFPSHVPMDGIVSLQHHLGDGGSPATAPHDGYGSTISHVFRLLYFGNPLGHVVDGWLFDVEFVFLDDLSHLLL